MQADYQFEQWHGRDGRIYRAGRAGVEVFERGTGFGQLGSGWQDIFASLVGAGATVYATHVAAGQQQQAGAAQEQAAFMQIYTPTYQFLQAVIDALNAHSIPQSQLQTALQQAQQAVAQFNAAVSPMAFLWANPRSWKEEVTQGAAAKLATIQRLVTEQKSSTATVGDTGTAATQTSGVGLLSATFTVFGYEVPVWSVAVGIGILLFSGRSS
jgi:hypothetical protein